MSSFFKAICGLKASNCGEIFDFLGNSIAYQRRMVTSTYVIKNKFTKANFFREIIADKEKYIPTFRVLW